jgi:ubiquitin-activating enzyme E1
MSKIDVNLYDRMIRTYGKDAVEKMASSSVLIYGLEKGLGTEVAKNLALCGIKTIYLYDMEPVVTNDLTTGFYYNKGDIGKPRCIALAPRIQELNPYVSINPTNSLANGQKVTIVINQPINVVREVNRYSRTACTKMVSLWSGGMSGTIFVDAGENHMVLDSTGENIESVQIANITLDGIVTLAPNNVHEFQSGDIIKFTNMDGNNMKEFEKEWEIDVVNKSSFKLRNFTNTGFQFINGTAQHIKVPITVNHMDFPNQLESPNLVASGAFDMDHYMSVVRTYIQMYSKSPDTNKLLIDTLPPMWKSDLFLAKYKVENKEIAKCMGLQFMPVVSIMGSFGASEVIKLVTNKYMPANQWFVWSDTTLIPNNKLDNEDMDYKSSYGEMYGIDLECRLMHSNWFLVGSGAIGCEHLKNLAYMGVGRVTVTDPDSIEKSNLNRQFLFRSQHIGKPKSHTAAEQIKTFNRNIHITPLLEKVGFDNIEFTNKLFESKDFTGVLNALDNIKARRFMDDQCFKFGLPLFESGTTGTKGNTQPVIPFVTETYSASSDPDVEKTFPLCTIKSFPNEIQHTIHWAMDSFEFFNRAPTTMNRWISNPNYLNELGQIEQSIAKEDINMFTVKYKTQSNIAECVKWAVDMFTENYHDSIVRLLTTYPVDHEVSPGVKFWSAGKRCPNPIIFDINNMMHLDYIEATTHLLARVSGLKDKSDVITRDEIKNMITQYKPSEHTIFTPTYVPQEFEKDDDTNYHIDWITIASNLRATNYMIPIEDRQKTKGIAGRIIPAIATTTSVVSGLILLEMLKYLLNYNDVTKYRSTFMNLANPILVHSDPITAPIIEVAGVKMNSWTKFEQTDDITLEEFKTKWEQVFKTTINMMVVGSAIVYAEFLNSDVLQNKLSKVLCETLECDTIPSNITMVIGCENDDIELPSININIQ